VSFKSPLLNVFAKVVVDQVSRLGVPAEVESSVCVRVFVRACVFVCLFVCVCVFVC
jgi:hypothetical protein